MTGYILMSIQTKYARKIFAGTKKWEFRKSLPRYSTLFPQRVVVYSAGVEKAIVGEFEVKRVVRTSFDELMKVTESDRDPKAVAWMKNYYKNKKVCGAIEVGDYQLYVNPITLLTLREAVPQFRPPQNFMYLQESHEIRQLIRVTT